MTVELLGAWRGHKELLKRKPFTRTPGLMAVSQTDPVLPQRQRKRRQKQKEHYFRIWVPESLADLIRKRAKDVGLSMNLYARAVIIRAEGDAQLPLPPAHHQAFLALNKELTLQGQHLKIIAERFREKGLTDAQCLEHLAALQGPLVGALRSVKEVMMAWVPHP